MVELIAALFVAAATVLAAQASHALTARARRAMPTQVRDRPEVQKYHAGLSMRPWTDTGRALVTSGWTLFYVAFFALLAIADFGLGFRIALAVTMGLVYGALTHASWTRKAKAVSHAVGWHGTRFQHYAASAPFDALFIACWVGWILAAALAGGAIGETIG
jgi:hypothetical protein